jgi:hypothetical protein
MNENYKNSGLDVATKPTVQSELSRMKSIVASIEDKILYTDMKEPNSGDGPVLSDRADDLILQVERINERLIIVGDVLSKLGLYNN